MARWQGEPPAFIHINSCMVRAVDLVCAMSNYPGVPMISSVERFDKRTLRHTGSHSFGPGPGSLTWIDWHNGSWWACFANYDGKGGDPSRDHRATVLVRFSATFTEQESWLFPDYVLDRFGHMSASGGRWGRGGLLYVTGHDLPEMYVLRLPAGGARLEYLDTTATLTGVRRSTGSTGTSTGCGRLIGEVPFWSRAGYQSQYRQRAPGLRSDTGLLRQLRYAAA